MERVQGNKYGFTLIEVMVSLGILGIILTVLYSSFSLVQDAVRRFDDVSGKYHDVRMTLDSMRREIESAIFSKNRRSRTFFRIIDRDIFGQRASRLELISLSALRDVPLEISYHVENHDGTLTLVKTERRLSPDSPPVEMDMIEGISGFVIETMYNSRWVRTWDAEEAGRLPEVIRITIEFTDNGRTVTLREYAIPMMGRRLS